MIVIIIIIILFWNKHLWMDKKNSVSIPQDPVFPSELVNSVRKDLDGNYFNVRHVIYPTKNHKTYDSVKRRMAAGYHSQKSPTYENV